MYANLEIHFMMANVKSDMMVCVQELVTCAQVKPEHKTLYEKMQRLIIPKQKCAYMTMGI